MPERHKARLFMSVLQPICAGDDGHTEHATRARPFRHLSLAPVAEHGVIGMKTVLLASLFAFGLAGPAAFAAVTTPAARATQPTVMPRDAGPQSAMAGSNATGFAGRVVPADNAAPAPVAPRHFRILPADPFQNNWGPGGAG